MPCLELGLDNWLTCPHLGKMLRMKKKVQLKNYEIFRMILRIKFLEVDIYIFFLKKI